MNTAVFYDEKPFSGEDEQNFAALAQPMLDSWVPVFKKFEMETGHIPEILPILGYVALMGWLAAKGNIPVKKSMIEAFREIFKIVRYNILENPQSCHLSDEDRAKLERCNMRLAKAITILDIANDPDIAALFPSAEK